MKVIDVAIDSKIPHGTQIVLKPDTSIFGDTEFSKEKFRVGSVKIIREWWIR